MQHKFGQINNNEVHKLQLLLVRFDGLLINPYHIIPPLRPCPNEVGLGAQGVGEVLRFRYALEVALLVG